jgi:hypothetical protein
MSSLLKTTVKEEGNKLKNKLKSDFHLIVVKNELEIDIISFIPTEH